MQKIFIIGNLTRDPQTRTVGSDHTVCSFTVAVNRRKSASNQPEADFFKVSAWDKLGDNCQRFLAKGRKVCVVGPVSVSSYEAKDGTTRFSLDVRAEDVEFLSAKNDGLNAIANRDNAEAKRDADAFDDQNDFDSDLPF